MNIENMSLEEILTSGYLDQFDIVGHEAFKRLDYLITSAIDEARMENDRYGEGWDDGEEESGGVGTYLKREMLGKSDHGAMR